MIIRHLRDAYLKEKRVLIRADFDVEIKGLKRPDSDIRIRANMDTICYILEKGGCPRIIAHRGRPKGKPEKKLSLEPFASHIERIVKRPVRFLTDPFDGKTMKTYRDSREIILFENIRFWSGEEENSTFFAKKLAFWADMYVNESFASCHREHASITALARILPSYAGIHLEREISVLGEFLRTPPRPFIAVLGGAKLETKLPLIKRFLKIADAVLLGGALANTLFALRGVKVGKSKVTQDENDLRSVRALYHKKLVLPSDVVASRSLKKGAFWRLCMTQDIRKDEYIADIGPHTIDSFAAKAEKAKSIVWNGPLGYYEVSAFASGTREFAKRLAPIRALKVIGGGDSVSMLEESRLLSGFSHVSTGGGAMLEFLSGKKLPGIEVLKVKNSRYVV